VEILCMTRAKPVENLTAKFFSARDANDPPRSRLCIRASRVPSLDRYATVNKIIAAPDPPSDHIHVIIHHFEETIGGRAYQIEVTAVSNRWRAQLQRGPGMPTAMMPFYGQTPDEAARQLSQWLSLAHQRFAAALKAAAPASTV
jgi:hypothetical protein